MTPNNKLAGEMPATNLIHLESRAQTVARLWKLAVGAACLVAANALGVHAAHAQQPAPAAPLTPAARIAASDNRFGLRLFETVHKSETAKDVNKNVCISPLSIALALQMTYNGANGTTREAMSHALELGGMTLDDVNKAASALLHTLPSSGQMRPEANGQAAASKGTATDAGTPRLEIANSLWLKDARTIRPDFISRTQQYYNAQVSSLQDAPDTINAWVDTHTHGKITKIVGPADVRDALAVLVNAVYFKAAWQSPFYKEGTSDKPFHLGDGTTQTSKMMVDTGHFNYYAGEGFQMISLPYRDCDLEMVIALPKAGTSLNAFLPRVTNSAWQQWTAKMTGQRGTVQLPRFRSEYGVDCTSALSALGMSEAFKPDADFSAMSRDRMRISKVIHKPLSAWTSRGRKPRRRRRW